VAAEAFYDLDAPIRRVASACVPLPFAANLEQAVVPPPPRSPPSSTRCWTAPDAGQKYRSTPYHLQVTCVLEKRPQPGTFPNEKVPVMVRNI
jgi:hypothetical protein